MKHNISKVSAIIAGCMIASSVCASAQEPKGVPISVFIPEEAENLPSGAADLLSTRMKAAVTQNGMGATEDVMQFYLTCKSNLIEKHIVPGAPTKYFNTAEVTFFVIDAFAQKVFTTTSIEVKGVGNSEQQAYTAGFRNISPSNAKISTFIKDSNKKILAYYDAQYRNIITKANSLAKVYKYEEALFQLAMVPEACVGYQEVLQTGVAIYQKYLDDKANKALAKARAIWIAGQNPEAAEKAAEYLGEIDPNAACYPEALALIKEIRERVRSVEDRDANWEHQEKMSTIEAWKAVGVAFGNGQKSNYYRSVL